MPHCKNTKKYKITKCFEKKLGKAMNDIANTIKALKVDDRAIVIKRKTSTKLRNSNKIVLLLLFPFSTYRMLDIKLVRGCRPYAGLNARTCSMITRKKWVHDNCRTSGAIIWISGMPYGNLPIITSWQWNPQCAQTDSATGLRKARWVACSYFSYLSS